jgi:hypothetical protein
MPSWRWGSVFNGIESTIDMKKQCLPVVASGLLAVLLTTAPVGEARPIPAVATSGASVTVTCSFSHPSYSGWCGVTRGVPGAAAARRFCSQTLACLNDVRCLQTICNATTIRGGWKLESVKTALKKR